MKFDCYDDKYIKKSELQKTVKKLALYRNHVAKVVTEADFSQSESSLACFKDLEAINAVKKIALKYKKVKHVVLVAIGGQSLGVEAVHAFLYNGKGPELHVLDTIAAHELKTLMGQLSQVKNVSDIVVCVSSKSGGTTETLTNAATLLALLEKKFGKKVHEQFVYVGTQGNNLLEFGKSKGSLTLSFQPIVGGRYSIFTASGLLPLLLLRHDIAKFLKGLESVTENAVEEKVAESAARTFMYMQLGFHTLNFFAFDTRLVRLGKWYRQLLAESLGKDKTLDNKTNSLGLAPTISTPVELHSAAQLYFSGFKGIYTDFVYFDDKTCDYKVPKGSKLVPSLAGKNHSEIILATYKGVLKSYEETKLPYRSTFIDKDLAFSVGQFMGMRMLEIMYLANLMNVNAFDQPNVELYKKITRKILGS